MRVRACVYVPVCVRLCVRLYPCARAAGVRHAQAAVEDSGGGVLRARCTLPGGAGPGEQGGAGELACALHVTLCGAHVAGSPFALRVRSRQGACACLYVCVYTCMRA